MSITQHRSSIQHTNSTADKASAAEIITVRPEAEVMTHQHLPSFVGICGATAGAKGISMNLVIIPPGETAEPHLHPGHESAIYILKGRVETRYGPKLDKTTINEAGDFIFIPPNVPHQPTNLSATEPVHVIVARNDADEQENVQLYEPGMSTTQQEISP
jgi:uncharacterized RmlC-like cupin family protein